MLLILDEYLHEYPHEYPHKHPREYLRECLSEYLRHNQLREHSNPHEGLGNALQLALLYAKRLPK